MEGAIDGLPLYSDINYADPSSSSANSITSSKFGSSNSLSDMVAVDTDSIMSIFRRKPLLEDIIAKFFKSAIHPHNNKSSSTSSYDINKIGEGSPKKVATKRVGIDSKSYKEYFDPEVTKRVKVDTSQCDILRTTSDLGIYVFNYCIS